MQIHFGCTSADMLGENIDAVPFIELLAGACHFMYTEVEFSRIASMSVGVFVGTVVGNSWNILSESPHNIDTI